MLQQQKRNRNRMVAIHVIFSEGELVQHQRIDINIISALHIVRANMQEN